MPVIEANIQRQEKSLGPQVKDVHHRPIRDVIEEVCLSGKWIDFIKWPPNIFALTWILLAESGAYRKINTVWPPNTTWEETVKEEKSHWIYCATDDKKKPGETVLKNLTTLKGHHSLLVGQIAESTELLTSILSLHVIADETCEYLCSRCPPDASLGLMRYLEKASRILTQTGSLASVPLFRAQVMPKQLTPSVGLTLRALSNYLTVRRASEVGSSWVLVPFASPSFDRINVLLIPWPGVIYPTDFSPISEKSLNLSQDRNAGRFKFAPRKKLPSKYVERIIKNAIAQVGSVQAVILPECAVSDREVETIDRLAISYGAFVIAGVRRPNQNCLDIRFPFLETLTQHKHHPWKLDRSQIEQYGLGSRLSPSREWWEAMSVEQRSITFIDNFSFCMCCLICEDLARAEPVAEIIRAVGPSIVFALLMDGPQLHSRWSARYARMLNEDPGSSVLTLTSLGMAFRSRPPGCSPSRTVAYWVDKKSGGRELTLDADADALAITLTLEYHHQLTIDGRMTSQPCWYYGGAEQIAAK